MFGWDDSEYAKSRRTIVAASLLYIFVVTGLVPITSTKELSIFGLQVDFSLNSQIYETIFIIGLLIVALKFYFQSKVYSDLYFDKNSLDKSVAHVDEIKSLFEKTIPTLENWDTIVNRVKSIEMVTGKFSESFLETISNQNKNVLTPDTFVREIHRGIVDILSVPNIDLEYPRELVEPINRERQRLLAAVNSHFENHMDNYSVKLPLPLASLNPTPLDLKSKFDAWMEKFLNSLGDYRTVYDKTDQIIENLKASKFILNDMNKNKGYIFGIEVFVAYLLLSISLLIYLWHMDWIALFNQSYDFFQRIQNLR
jgi:hypothetical protein